MLRVTGRVPQFHWQGISLAVAIVQEGVESIDGGFGQRGIGLVGCAALGFGDTGLQIGLHGDGGWSNGVLGPVFEDVREARGLRDGCVSIKSCRLGVNNGEELPIALTLFKRYL